MKKLTMFLAALSLVVGIQVGSVAAQEVENDTCVITSTGPGSVNSCTFDEDNVVTVVCTNGVNVTNINTQVAESGEVTVEGNTISGNASSGDAENINTFANAIALGCLTAAATPTPTVTPTAGGGGAAAPAPAAAKVTALPKTGVNDTAKTASIAGASVLALAGLSQAALSLYRHRSLN